MAVGVEAIGATRRTVPIRIGAGEPIARIRRRVVATRPTVGVIVATDVGSA